MQQHLLAQIYNPVIPNVIGNGLNATGGSALGILIGNLMGGIMIIAFLLAIVFLLLGGMSWISSGGDKAQLEAARNKIIHSIMGLIVIASTWAILNLLGPFLGINFPNLPIPEINQSTTSSTPTSNSTPGFWRGQPVQTR
jgi:hypothetical protein